MIELLILYDFGAGGNFLAHLVALKILCSTFKETFTERNEYVTDYSNMRTMHYTRVNLKDYDFESHTHYILINHRTAQVKEYTTMLGDYKKNNTNLADIDQADAEKIFEELSNLDISAPRIKPYVRNDHNELRTEIMKYTDRILEIDYEDLFLKRNITIIKKLFKFLGVGNMINDAAIDDIIKELEEYVNENNKQLRTYFNI